MISEQIETPPRVPKRASYYEYVQTSDRAPKNHPRSRAARANSRDWKMPQPLWPTSGTDTSAWTSPP